MGVELKLLARNEIESNMRGACPPPTNAYLLLYRLVPTVRSFSTTTGVIFQLRTVFQFRGRLMRARSSWNPKSAHEMSRLAASGIVANFVGRII